MTTTTTALQAQYLTVIYKVKPGQEAVDLLAEREWCFAGWCHAIKERDEARAALSASPAAQDAPAEPFHMSIDEARRRMLASPAPSLATLQERLGGIPEVPQGEVLAARTQPATPAAQDAAATVPCFAIYRTEDGVESFHAALWHDDTKLSANERYVNGKFVPDAATPPAAHQVAGQGQADGREAFEAFFASSRSSRGKARAAELLVRMPGGDYVQEHTQRHWWTWQNARASNRRPVRAAPTAPQAQAPALVPLTDAQVERVLKRSDLRDMMHHIGWYSAPEKAFKKHGAALVRDIERELGITPTTKEQTK